MSINVMSTGYYPTAYVNNKLQNQNQEKLEADRFPPGEDNGICQGRCGAERLYVE